VCSSDLAKGRAVLEVVQQYNINFQFLFWFLVSSKL